MSTTAFVLIVLKEVLSNSISKGCESSKTEFKKEVALIDGVDSIYIFEQGEAPYNAILKITTPTLNLLHKIVIGTVSKLPMVKETKTMIVLEN